MSMERGEGREEGWNAEGRMAYWTMGQKAHALVLILVFINYATFPNSLSSFVK